MPSPREIALSVNRGSGDNGFGEEPDADPPVNPVHKEKDYRANPVNPPDKPVPARNLKGGV